MLAPLIVFTVELTLAPATDKIGLNKLKLMDLYSPQKYQAYWQELNLCCCFWQPWQASRMNEFIYSVLKFIDVSF